MRHYDKIHAVPVYETPDLTTEKGLLSSVMKALNDRSEIDSWLDIFLGEVIGTSLLMYMGCMGLFSANLVPLQGGFLWGGTVSCIIIAFGHLSKAHLNPCVSLSALIWGNISPLTFVIYVIAELLGAILGMCAVKISVPGRMYDEYSAAAGPCGFCATAVHNDLSISQAFFLEFMATFLLIITVCSIWDPRNAKINDSIPIKFALLIVTVSIAIGPFTGASMNPARSLAPAIINNGWENHWIYWAAPLSSSAFTSLFYRFVFLKKPAATPGAAGQNKAMLKSESIITRENETIAGEV